MKQKELLICATKFCNLQHENVLRDKLIARTVVIRETLLCNLQRNNVARQVARFCCPYYCCTYMEELLTQRNAQIGSLLVQQYSNDLL